MGELAWDTERRNLLGGEDEETGRELGYKEKDVFWGPVSGGEKGFQEVKPLESFRIHLWEATPVTSDHKEGSPPHP